MPSRAGPITSKPPLALSSVRAFGMGRPFLLILGHGLSPYSVTATASVARLWWNRQATSDLDHFSIVLLVQTIADAIRPMSFSIAALDVAVGVREGADRVGATGTGLVRYSDCSLAEGRVRGRAAIARLRTTMRTTNMMMW
jgi:hypothetical protein